jgi:anti-sigma B factor antagonist
LCLVEEVCVTVTVAGTTDQNELGTPGQHRQPAVVVAHGELDIADDALRRTLVALASDGQDVVVDLLNVTFIDSSVVRALLLAHREVTERGRWLRVVYTHHLIRRVIEICGLTELLPQYTSVEAAVRGVHSTVQRPEADGRQGQ